MDLDEPTFADMDRLMDEIADRCELTKGTALLAVVADPQTEQTLTHVERLPVDCRIGADEDVSDLLHDTMQRLPVPDFAGPGTRHVVLTVIVRPGLAVPSRCEMRWSMGWRYSNHLRGAFTGDLVMVTEHGWADLFGADAGRTPEMRVA